MEKNRQMDKITIPSFSEEKKIMMKQDKDEEERGMWGNQREFFLSCLGYAVGFGNVWRFPYLAYKNGGAAFLIPYVIMLLCTGLPLFFMELVLGQYTSLGPNIIFPKMAPIFAGLGWGMIMVSALVSIYYNVILAWAFFYTFASFTSELPWTDCDNDFNTPECYLLQEDKVCKNMSMFYYNQTCLEPDAYCGLVNLVSLNASHCYDPNENDSLVVADGAVHRITPSEDYYRNRVLGVTGKTWEDMGGMQWELVGCLALAWLIVFACMVKGVKTSGKVVYFTALFPYVVLIILFGKVRAFRKGLPKEVTKAKIKKGEVASLENDEGIKVFNWKDKRNVFILSTVPEHDDKLIATGKLSRNGEEIKKPKCVMDYNKAKKGVDLSDQLSSYYTALRKNRKWYKKVALELVTGSCVVNAFIIFNKYLSDKKWTLLQFKESIILSLLTDSPFEKIRPGRKLSYKVSPSGPQHFLSEAEGSKRESRKRCVGCYEMISTNEGSKVASKRAKKISTFCSSCDGKPYLCLSCFETKHSK